MFVFLVSLNQLSQIFGLVLARLISDRLGRKKALCICSLLQILTSVAVHFSSSFTTPLLAITFSACFNTLFLNPSYSFLSEISLIRIALKITENLLLFNFQVII